MNLTNNFTFIEKNIINFSILSQKKNSVFQIYKVAQNIKNIDRNNLIPVYETINQNMISKGFSKGYNGVTQKTYNLQRVENFSFTKDNSKEKFSSNDNIDTKKNNDFLSLKKKLRKKNNNYILKEKKFNTLIKPILFEKKEPLNTDNINKVEIKPNIFENSFNSFNFKNKKDFIFNKFNNNFNVNLYKNNNLIKNNYQPKNSLAFPYSFQNINNYKNISFNFDNINKNIDNSKTILNIPNFNISYNPINKVNLFKNIIEFNDKINITKQCTDSSISLNNSNQNTIKKNKLIIKYINTRKGRKSKNSKACLSESKHTKFSEDNMMRKIKNKIIESSRLLVNKVFKEEMNAIRNKINYIRQEFSKIKGSFSQELNIKYNLYFYQMKIKDIFSLELSNKYTAIEKNLNKELIDYIFSEENKNLFIKTKALLDMPFHQYYHDIFLGEEQRWKTYFGINLNDNKYQIHNLFQNLETNEDNGDNNEYYIKLINNLAHNYENFFLSKKTRNVGLGNKKEDWIKSFMQNITKEQYEYYLVQIKQCKNYYETRYKLNNNKTLDNEFIINTNAYEKDKKKLMKLIIILIA